MIVYYQKTKKTRQHSSMIHATHLPTLHVSVATTRCPYQWGVGWGIVLQVNKFEHVSIDNQKMSVAGRRGSFLGLMSGGGKGGGGDREGKGTGRGVEKRG